MAGKNKKQKQEMENGKFYLAGTVTTAMFGKRTFANGKTDKEDKYRISLKVTKDMLEKFKEACEPYYEDVDDKWLPDFMKNDIDADGGYINLSSNYDIRCGEYNKGEVIDKGNMTEYISNNGGNINGSKVVVLVTIKEGSYYPAAMIVKELHVVDLSSMFNNSDEFAALMDGDDLPF